MSERSKAWIKAAGARAVKTVAQTAVATIGTGAAMGDVAWGLVASASCLAGILSLLTSVAGLAKHLVDIQGDVGLGLGSEPNQICAVSFPSPIDHFVTEMCGVEGYGRYMDDSHAIALDKETLRITLAVIRDACARLGIEVNEKKTRIVKLSHGFTYLKKKFSYGENGEIVVRPCRDSITGERRKLKKQHALYEQGLMTYEQVVQSYQSWRGGMKRLDAHATVLSMDALFKSLFSGQSGAEKTPPTLIPEADLPLAA